MADIFISYKKEDAGRVIRIVEALRAEGLTVWWDHGISPGAQWDQTIHTELESAKCVLAIWSKASVAAPWVKEEATFGKNRGILLPVCIDKVDPPLGFTLIQAADLIDWTGDTKDPRWARMLEAVRSVIAGRPLSGMEVRTKPSQPKAPMGGIIAALAVIVAALVGIGWYLSQQRAAPAAAEAGQPTIAAPVAATSAPDASAPAPAAADPALAPALTPTPAAPAPAPAASSGSGKATAPTDAEIDDWDKANIARTRTAFRDFLAKHPKGFYSDQALAFIASCRVEQTESWAFKQEPRTVPGRNAQPLPTLDDACAAARAAAQAMWEGECGRIAAARPVKARTVASTGSFNGCPCEEGAGGWTCNVEGHFSCQYEEQVLATKEICGAPASDPAAAPASPAKPT